MAGERLLGRSHEQTRLMRALVEAAQDQEAAVTRAAQEEEEARRERELSLVLLSSWPAPGRAWALA